MAEQTTTTETTVTEPPVATKPAEVKSQTNTDETTNAEIARLKAELTKANAAKDKATSEAADFKKQLRAKQSAEEAAAEEAREANEARDRELAELRKKFAVAETGKKVMGFVGDEAVATAVAEYLYGAEDVDAALDAISKAWTAKEKALRLEFGKIPAPGAGTDDGPTLSKEDILKIKDPVARQNAIAQNIQLFTKG